MGDSNLESETPYKEGVLYKNLCRISSTLLFRAKKEGEGREVWVGQFTLKTFILQVLFKSANWFLIFLSSQWKPLLVIKFLSSSVPCSVVFACACVFRLFYYQL